MSKVDRREQNRVEILKAAAKVISKHGFHGMSMRKLARSTKKGLATFYNYFDSKEEVLFELQRRTFETLIDKANHALDAVSDSEERLYAFIENHIHYFVDNPDVMQVLVREAATLPAGWRHVIRGLKERYFDLGRDVVVEVLVGVQNQQPGKQILGIMRSDHKLPGKASRTDRRESQMGKGDQGYLNAEELECLTYGIFGMLNWVYGWYQPSRHGDYKEVALTLYELAIRGIEGMAFDRTG